jgi:hypothetical protein
MSLGLWSVLAGCGGGDDAASSDTRGDTSASSDAGAGGTRSPGEPSDGATSPRAPNPSSSAAKGGDGAAGGAGHGEAGARQPEAGSGGAAAPIMHASSFDRGSDPDRNKVSGAEICKRLSEIDCAAEAFCCDRPGRTVDACKADVLKVCSQDLMLDQAAQNPITGFDQTAAQTAYTELEERASQCDPGVAAWAGSSQGLRGLLKGTVAPGASCKPPQSLPDPTSIASALVSCRDPEHSACMYTNPFDDWTCTPRAADGGACLTDNNCQEGLYCVLPTLAVNGSCTSRKEVDASCNEPRECKSLFCKKSKCVAADQQAAYCLVN